MNADEETNVTDIELLPDGRICVFGTSAEVLAVLDELQGGKDAAITHRLHHGGNSSDTATSQQSVTIEAPHGHHSP